MAVELPYFLHVLFPQQLADTFLNKLCENKTLSTLFCVFEMLQS